MTKGMIGQCSPEPGQSHAAVSVKKKSPGTPPRLPGLCALNRMFEHPGEQPEHHPLRSWLKMDRQKGEAPARGENPGPRSFGVFGGRFETA